MANLLRDPPPQQAKVVTTVKMHGAQVALTAQTAR
jgi:hypothetical protein